MILIKIWSIQRLKNIPIATFKNGSFLISKKIQHLYFTLFINTLIPNQLNIKIVIYLHSLKLKSCIKTDNAIFIEYLKKKENWSNSGNNQFIRTKLKINISHNAVSVYTGFKMEGDGDNDKIPEIKYHRRLDRSPEKVLKLMNEYDKKLISEFRRAKENARHKLVDLQDEIDDRCV